MPKKMSCTSTKQSRSRGTANSSRNHMSKKKSSDPKSEKISKYFAKSTKNGDSSGSLSDSPYKDCLNNIKSATLNCSESDLDDFKTPKAVKVSKIKNSTKPQLPKNHAKKRKKVQVPIKKFIEDNLSHSDVNPEHLQMALALSESENPSGSQERMESFKKALESYGFGYKNKIPVEQKLAPSDTSKKNNKKSRYRYVTPILKIRTAEERESLISSKVCIILAQNERISTNYTNCNNTDLFCDLLKKYRVGGKIFKLNNLSLEELNGEGRFYVRALGLETSPSTCGKLLKNWGKVAGRDLTPERQVANWSEAPPTNDKMRDVTFQAENLESHPLTPPFRGILAWKTPEDFTKIGDENNIDESILYQSTNEYKTSTKRDLIGEDINLKLKNFSQRKLEDSPPIPEKCSFNLQKRKVECVSPDLFDSDGDSESKESFGFVRGNEETLPLVISNSAQKMEYYDLTQSSDEDKKSLHSNPKNCEENVEGLDFLDLHQPEFEDREDLSSLRENSESEEKITEDIEEERIDLNGGLLVSKETECFGFEEKEADFHETSEHSSLNLEKTEDLDQSEEIEWSNLAHSVPEEKTSFQLNHSKSEYSFNHSFHLNLSNPDYSLDQPSNLNVTDYVNNFLSGNRISAPPPQKLEKISTSEDESQQSQDTIYISDDELNYSSVFYSPPKKKIEYDLSDDEYGLASNISFAEGCKSKSKIPKKSPLNKTPTQPPLFSLEESTVSIPNNTPYQPPKTNSPLKITNQSSLLTNNPLLLEDSINKVLQEMPSNTPNKSTNGDFLIKTNNVTPMPNYDEMDTPKIRNELDKFGLKPLKRQKGAKLLKYIYESTHPLVADEDGKILKKRKVLFPQTGDVIEDVGEEGDLIFERTQSKRIASCRIPLHIVWHNFIMSNPKIRENILLYEPLQLEVLHSMLKAQGFKFNIQDLLIFLDKKCITVRTAQGPHHRKRKKAQINDVLQEV